MLKKRKELQLSQVELSVRSGVSLPTLQRIESGKANPSLSTLELLTSALDLELSCNDVSVDWDELAAYGLPLQRREIRHVRKTRENFLTAMCRACSSLIQERQSPDFSRKKEALIGTLLALKLHYADLYKELCHKCPMVEQLFQDTIEGKHIKLKRLALAQIGTYL
ncbi:helix-turn-helix domain-containing protein [Nitrospira sp. M1]